MYVVLDKGLKNLLELSIIYCFMCLDFFHLVLFLPHSSLYSKYTCTCYIKTGHSKEKIGSWRIQTQSGQIYLWSEIKNQTDKIFNAYLYDDIRLVYDQRMNVLDVYKEKRI